MSFKVKVTTDDTIWEKLMAWAKRVSRNGVQAAAEGMRDHMWEIEGGFYPPASNPGDPPNIRTGKLHVSMQANRLADNQWEVVAGGGGAFYARYLEYGTGKMAARPFFTPSLMWTKQNFSGFFVKETNLR